MKRRRTPRKSPSSACSGLSTTIGVTSTIRSSGPGTTVIAGELEERHVFALEIEPAYVDVTVKRWEDFTGQKAIQVTTP